MLTALVIAASLAVPYLPQTDALCGGAAAAMVFRYWGDAHATAETFAPLVDRRAGGIADDVLVRAIENRGWRTARPAGSVEMLRTEIERSTPVVILVAERENRYHYLVVTGVTAAGVIVHDPSWGPSRHLSTDQLTRIWRPTNFWSLVILPVRLKPDATDVTTNVTTQAPVVSGVSRTLTTSDLGERAGRRFVEHQWDEAANLATQALALDRHDVYAWDVLGSSRFMQDKPDQALDAWNQIGKPRVDAVRIDGLGRTRYQTIASLLGLTPGTLLTADALRLAERRAEDLPDRTASSVTFRPAADGFAQVDVAIVEHPDRPRGTFAWAAEGIHAGIDREIRLDVPGFTGQGELWSASWRWWSGRPRVAVGFATPALGALPGVWRVDASWDSQAYALGHSPAPDQTETRLHGSLSVSDWITSRVRYTVSSGFDSWNGAGRTASIGGSLERRWLADRWSAAVNATTWLPVIDSGSGFQQIGLRVGFRSTHATDGWTYRADAGADRASDAAPFGLWPGASDGQAREPLLRAHPLLAGGTIDLDEQRGAAFGRTLTHGTVETARWFASSSPLRIAIAGFADAARADRGVSGNGSRFQMDLGAGVRIRIPGADGVLRVDIAHGLRDGANGLSAGWQF